MIEMFLKYYCVVKINYIQSFDSMKYLRTIYPRAYLKMIVKKINTTQKLYKAFTNPLIPSAPIS